MALTQIFGDTAISIVGFLFILSFLVVIHELGHFLTALWLKVKIEEFGLGYPPRARTLFHWRGIPFTLNWLPFGGFVRMEGEDGPQEADPALKEDTHSKKRNSHQSDFQPFYAKSKKNRLVVLLAGVFINFVFGILAFAIVYTVKGFPRLVNENELVIEQVMENSPAATAGIQVGDKVESATVSDSTDAQSFQETSEFVQYVNGHLGENLNVTLDRQGQKQVAQVFLRPVDQRPEGEGALGIGFALPTVVYDFYPWWQMPFRGAWVGFQESIMLSMQILDGFKTMISGLVFHAQVPQDIAGPIGIVHQATKFGLFQSSWDVVLKFAGMLSVNLAILNFLPIPALDGGRAFFVIAEKFIGNKRRELIESKVNYIGFAFLLGLIVLISIKDVWSVFADVLQYFRNKPI